LIFVFMVAREQSSSPPGRPGHDGVDPIHVRQHQRPQRRVLTHANLLANIRAMGEALDASSSSGKLRRSAARTLYESRSLSKKGYAL
jgi:hypothetical protein